MGILPGRWLKQDREKVGVEEWRKTISNQRLYIHVLLVHRSPGLKRYSTVLALDFEHPSAKREKQYLSHTSLARGGLGYEGTSAARSHVRV